VLEFIKPPGISERLLRQPRPLWDFDFEPRELPTLEAYSRRKKAIGTARPRLSTAKLYTHPNHHNHDLHPLSLTAHAHPRPLPVLHHNPLPHLNTHHSRNSNNSNSPRRLRRTFRYVETGNRTAFQTSR
jgi:hypothetical protein